MNNPLLSICIPTYNQPEQMGRLLESVISQLDNRIEVIVKDDSSNNETAAVVGRYSSKFPIKYIHGKKEGLDAAIIFLTTTATGKYVWWIGDDAIVEGGVQRVANFFSKNDVSFLFVNCINGFSGDSQFNLGESKFFKNGSDALEQILSSGLGFISATLFKRELALSGIEQSKKYLGTACVNLYLIYYVLMQRGQLYYMGDPVIINYPASTEEIKEVVIKKDNSISNDAFQVFGINFFTITKEFESKFGRGVVRKVLKESFASLWRGILVAWVGGWDTPRGKRWRMFKTYWSFPEFWIAMPLLCLPLWLNKFLYRLYKIAFSHRKLRFGMGATK